MFLNLFFLQKLRTCDWPASAGCKKKNTGIEGGDIDSIEVDLASLLTTESPSSTTQWMWTPDNNRPATVNRPTTSTSKPTTSTEWTWKPENEWSWTSTTTEEPWPDTPYEHPLSGKFL